MAVNVLGNSFFGIEQVQNQITYSSDRPYDFLLIGLFIILSLIITTIWHFLNTDSNKLEPLNDVLQVVTRYYLLYAMFSYGVKKVLLVQFVEPGFLDLLTPYGHSSPMKLAWTFVGFSPGYSILTGSLEVVGALLLINRKTIVSGTLILLVVMVNVLAINLFYDAPVKQHSFHLIAMLCLVLYPFRKRIIGLFFTTKQISEVALPTYSWVPLQLDKLRKVKIMIVVAIVTLGVVNTSSTKRDRRSQKAEVELYGLHKIYLKDTDLKATRFENCTYLLFEFKGIVHLIYEDRTVDYFYYKQSNPDTLLLYKNEGEETRIMLSMQPSDGKNLITWQENGETLMFTTTRIEKTDFPLLIRKFHLIQEAPYFENSYKLR